MQASKPLWGEGLFLRPQHFQQQDAYHEWRLVQMSRALHPYAHGLMQLKVDEESLAAGLLRVDELRVVMPDGELVDAPGEDELPAAVSLADWPVQQTEMVFHLALAPLRSAGSNVADSREAARSERYVLDQQATRDVFTQAAEAELTVLRKSLRLLSELEPRSGLITLPLLRVRRGAAGGFELDAGFVPPLLQLRGSPLLQRRLRQMLDMLQAKVDALYGFHREPSKDFIEFRSGDVASFWLLHTASRAFAELAHLHWHPQLHPERLFQGLLSLAGALLTFAKSYRLADLPVYEHENPGAGFDKLELIIRELLDTVISTRHLSLALLEQRPGYWHARLDSDFIGAQTQLLLGIRSSLPPQELVETMPMRLKIGAPDDVAKLVLSAMAGLRLQHQPQVPSAVPVKPNTYYFLIEARGPLYDRMMQARALCLYAPSGIPELQTDLIAINP